MGLRMLVFHLKGIMLLSGGISGEEGEKKRDKERREREREKKKVREVTKGSKQRRGVGVKVNKKSASFSSVLQLQPGM